MPNNFKPIVWFNSFRHPCRHAEKQFKCATYRIKHPDDIACNALRLTKIK